MADPPKRANPFFGLSLAVAAVFVVTACAYGLMLLRGISVTGGGEIESSGLMGFLRRHGMTVIIVEVILLGVFAILAMATDEFWTRRGRKDNNTDRPGGEADTK